MWSGRATASSSQRPASEPPRPSWMRTAATSSTASSRWTRRAGSGEKSSRVRCCTKPYTTITHRSPSPSLRVNEQHARPPQAPHPQPLGVPRGRRSPHPSVHTSRAGAPA
ncbi:unnamed protein product [Gulo gulo]|uniref:Uncharacterized protein n=1 Tax=Gulo gulo TaxID=48420 RepID=A0A9X9Q0P8_GULGU|nr:unnamed protein product [Gulo gulo]